MNKKIKLLKAFIKNNHDFIITTHVSPDGDAIGSEIALIELLKKLGKKVIIFNSSATPEILKFIDVDNEIKIIDTEKDIQKLKINIDKFSVFILDCNEPDRTGEATNNFIITKARDYFIIDHHLTNIDDDNYLVRDDLIATCEIIYYIIKAFDKVKINFKMAQALYTGIYTDSGSFVFPRTSSNTFMIISELVKIGVEPNIIYNNIDMKASTSKLKLIGKLLNSIRYEAEEKVAILIATDDILTDVGANYSDLDDNDIVNFPLRAEKTLVSILIKDTPDKTILKVSLRSKSDIDVRKVAKKFGGGGHKNASGFKSHLGIETLINQILDNLNISTISLNCSHL